MPGPNSNNPQDEPTRDESPSTLAPQQHAAANLVRGKISHIYETDPPNQPQKTESDSPKDQGQNPYNRTHDPEKSAPHWQRYHSAWQSYYQQYYHRYYLGQLHTQAQAVEAERAKNEAKNEAKSNFDAATKPQTIVGVTAPKTVARPEIEALIKHDLVKKIQERAKHFRSSHHFMPILSAVIVGVLFLGIQYNRLVVAQVMAYVSPGNTSSQSIIVDPTTDTRVGPAPKLIIPKINVDVPVVYGVKSLDNDTVQKALYGGVVHYPIPGANSLPGQAGNNVILGHSSNDVFDGGNYKFAFVMLERLEKGDVFYINYKSTRYTYSVTSKKVINPDQVNTLVSGTKKPLASLVTCTPVGTALQRLVVTAEQVSPDPGKATPKTSAPKNQNPGNIPGNSPTLLERLFGGG